MKGRDKRRRAKARRGDKATGRRGDKDSVEIYRLVDDRDHPAQRFGLTERSKEHDRKTL